MSAGLMSECYSCANNEFLARVDGKLRPVRIGADSQIWSWDERGQHVVASSADARSWLAANVVERDRERALTVCRPQNYTPVSGRVKS